MPRKKSSNPNFTVAETVGEAAEGEDSLLALNNRIQQATTSSEVFEPMKRICAALAVHRKIITPGTCKIRKGGSPDDFLNFATLNYVLRWKKQFEPAHGRKPVAEIQNWIPYISNTIRYCLINYNKEVQDYDFLPLPTRYTDLDSGATEESCIAFNDEEFSKIELRCSLTVDAIHSIIESLPEELWPYKADILYYINSRQKKFVDERAKNYVIIGKNLFYKGLAEWLGK